MDYLNGRKLDFHRNDQIRWIKDSSNGTDDRHLINIKRFN